MMVLLKSRKLNSLSMVLGKRKRLITLTCILLFLRSLL